MTARHPHRASMTILLVALCVLPACRSIYYDTLEAFGTHKRDLLVTRVTDARDDQEAAKEQFVSALDRFTALVGAPDGELSRLYRDLNEELKRSESKADAVRDRIEAVETVGGDLFREWEAELEQYASGDLRRASREKMEQTRSRYDQLVAAMKRPEQKMDAVLEAFRDQVLYVKHNLNAQAISSLQGTVETLEFDTAELVRDMEAAIAEADSFIHSMGAEA